MQTRVDIGSFLHRQTVFYTPETLTVSAGDIIKGTLTCAPNKRNNRDLDITISYGLQDKSEVSFAYKMCVNYPFPFEETLNGCQVIIVICLYFVLHALIHVAFLSIWTTLYAGIKGYYYHHLLEKNPPSTCISPRSNCINCCVTRRDEMTSSRIESDGSSPAVNLMWARVMIRSRAPGARSVLVGT